MNKLTLSAAFLIAACAVALALTLAACTPGWADWEREHQQNEKRKLQTNAP